MDFDEKEETLQFLPKESYKKGPVKYDSCKEKIPPCLDDQASTKRFLGYLIVATFIIGACLYQLYGNIADFSFYSKETYFPGLVMLPLMTVISILILSYCAYLMNGNLWVFWSYIVVLVIYTFWFLNLILRTEYFAKGAEVPSNGALFLIVCILGIVVMLLCASKYSVGVVLLLLIVLVWFMFLLYNWLFRDVRRKA